MQARVSHRLAVVSALALLLGWPATAQAQYLDPGAGSIIVQVVIAAFIGVAAAVKLYWGKLSGLLVRRHKRSSEI